MDNSVSRLTMNLRKSKLAEEILEGIELINIEKNSLILISLPPGLTNIATNNIGQSVQNALSAMGIKNPLLLVPNDIKIEQIPLKEMESIGYKYVGTTTSDTPSDRLQGRGQSNSEPEGKLYERNVWTDKAPDHKSAFADFINECFPDKKSTS